jgi:hypothetical protein
LIHYSNGFRGEDIAGSNSNLSTGLKEARTAIGEKPLQGLFGGRKGQLGPGDFVFIKEGYLKTFLARRKLGGR